jgi:predicted ATPase
MKLTHLSIVGLHEALTLDVQFNDEITLLIGINGSGKTSVLNAIDWLLKPDLTKLAVATYKKLSLSFEHKDTPYVLTASKTSSLLTLSLTGSKTPMKPITVTLVRNLDPDDEDAAERYDGLRPEPHEKPLWDFLHSFAKPTAISLDRTISAESDAVEYVETSRGTMRRHVRAKTPLGYVQEITSEKYAAFRSKAIANDSELKAQIVISALQDPEIVPEGSSFKPMTEAEIARLEQKVVTYLTGTIKSGDIAGQIHRFFESSKMLAQSKASGRGGQDLLIDFVTSRYRQIERLAKAFNDFETKNSSEFKELSDYLSAVNRFLVDSNKVLYFDESTGKLVFSFGDQKTRKGLSRAVSHLSSGERQILILFTFLAFASRSESVFIVDEPELSLHPKWQHEFMEVFLSLRPRGTQLLLATHSPDIVGRFKTACVKLRSSRA